MEEERQYLEVKNWNEFQPRLKNGRPRRDWIRLDTNLEDDAQFIKLTPIERYVLIGIWRIRGRTGKNPPYDAHFIHISLTLGTLPRNILLTSLGHLIDLGFLALSNQQIPIENPLQDKTREDGTVRPPTPRKKKPRGIREYSPEFLRLWQIYPRGNGKREAFAAFLKLRCENGDVERIARAIDRYKLTETWQRDGGQYVPWMQKFLNKRMFEDFDEEETDEKLRPERGESDPGVLPTGSGPVGAVGEP